MRFCYVLILILLFLSCKTQREARQKTTFEENFSNGYHEHWQAENHTFDNNLAHFSENNVSLQDKQIVLKLENKKHREKKL